MTGGRDPRRPGGMETDGPNDIERSPEFDAVTGELSRFAALADENAPAGFADRVMAAVEASPPPARSRLAGILGAWLAAFSGPARRSLRMVAVAAVVVLAVGGALVGGELSGLLRQGPSQTGSSGSPSVSPSVMMSPSPTLSPTPEPSGTPEPTDSATGSPGATATDKVVETPQPETLTPRPSASEGSGGGSETPQPTQTPEPSPSPSSSSGDG